MPTPVMDDRPLPVIPIDDRVGCGFGPRRGRCRASAVGRCFGTHLARCCPRCCGGFRVGFGVAFPASPARRLKAATGCRNRVDWSGERTTLCLHAAMAQVAAGHRQLGDVLTDRRWLCAPGTFVISSVKHLCNRWKRSNLWSVTKTHQPLPGHWPAKPHLRAVAPGATSVWRPLQTRAGRLQHIREAPR